MTKEYLTNFKPDDVLMVVLRCVSCGGESSFPVSGSSPMLLINKCPACGKERDPESGDHMTQVSNLLNALRDARDVSANAALYSRYPDIGDQARFLNSH